jgi:hypothetical protein
MQVSLSTRISLDTYRALVKHCKNFKLSQAKVVELALKEYLEREKREK